MVEIGYAIAVVLGDLGTTELQHLFMLSAEMQELQNWEGNQVELIQELQTIISRLQKLSGAQHFAAALEDSLEMLEFFSNEVEKVATQSVVIDAEVRTEMNTQFVCADEYRRGLFELGNEGAIFVLAGLLPMHMHEAAEVATAKRVRTLVTGNTLNKKEKLQIRADVFAEELQKQEVAAKNLYTASSDFKVVVDTLLFKTAQHLLDDGRSFYSTMYV